MKWKIVSLACLASVFTAAACFGSTSYSTDFSEFNVGSFVGQQGWLGNATSGLSGGSHLDEEIVDLNGNKVFRLSNAVTSGNYATTHPTPPAVNLAGEGAIGAAYRSFTYSFDFRSTTDQYQDGLVIMPTGYRHDTASRHGLVYIGDAADGLYVRFYDFVQSGFRGTEISGLSRTDWHNVSVEMNFADGPDNDTAILTVDGVSYGGLTTWENYYWSAGSPQPTVEGVDGLIFRIAGASVPAVQGGGLYFDNLSYGVSDPVGGAPIPEPVTLTGLGLAATGLVRYLRRRRN